jgi:hypothetical protein
MLFRLGGGGLGNLGDAEAMTSLPSEDFIAPISLKTV